MGMAETVLEIETLFPPLPAQLPNPVTPEMLNAGKTGGAPLGSRPLRPSWERSKGVGPSFSAST